MKGRSFRGSDLCSLIGSWYQHRGEGSAEGKPPAGLSLGDLQDWLCSLSSESLSWALQELTQHRLVCCCSPVLHLLLIYVSPESPSLGKLCTPLPRTPVTLFSFLLKRYFWWSCQQRGWSPQLHCRTQFLACHNYWVVTFVPTCDPPATHSEIFLTYSQHPRYQWKCELHKHNDIHRDVISSLWRGCALCFCC